MFQCYPGFPPEFAGACLAPGPNELAPSSGFLPNQISVAASDLGPAQPPDHWSRAADATNMSDSQSFPRTARILKHATFENVYQNGKKVFSPQMIIFYMPRVAVPGADEPTTSGPRIGLTVGKKLGGAVDRNRIKRRMRAAVGSAMSELGSDLAADIVINARKTVLSSNFAGLQVEVRKSFAAVRSGMSKSKGGSLAVKGL